MKVAITLDDALLAKAQEYSGLEDPSAIVHAALTTLVQVEAGRLLARLGGTEPNAEAPPRRRWDP
jgi:Arc/MetJ family transcription regulator